MSSAYTIPTMAEPTTLFVDTASGPWTPTAGVDQRPDRKSPQGFFRPIGIGLSFALSPLTSVADPWILERRRQSQPTAYVLIESAGRRRISLREARQLALQLMADIEAARLRAAEEEARRTFDLEGFA